MRLQILHLPAPPDEYPFALVFDKCGDTNLDELREVTPGAIGARGVLAFESEVEVE